MADSSKIKHHDVCTILVVIGTRPEAIKMAMVIKALKAKKGIRCVVCITAQHRSMLDQVLQQFEITADHDLDIMHPNQQLADLSGRMISALQRVIDKEKPDLVLVHGDTNTTLAGALAAFYNKIPVGHVEAGMRTGNLQLPFPEEANRVLTTRIASVHFAATQLNVKHLKAEKIPTASIIKTGNTVIDALLHTAKQTKQFSKAITDERVIHSVKSGRKIILVTGHRRENFGEGMQEICTALATIAARNPKADIIYPVHLNPNVQDPVYAQLSDKPNIILTQPMGYADFVYLMKKSYLIITDSGGIQEEGPAFGKPVLVMRDVTERPEAVKAGTVILVGTKSKKIIRETEKLLADRKKYERMSRKVNPYGDGKAAKRIADWIAKNQNAFKQRNAL